jgi:hypothetical protein
LLPVSIIRRAPKRRPHATVTSPHGDEMRPYPPAMRRNPGVISPRPHTIMPHPRTMRYRTLSRRLFSTATRRRPCRQTGGLAKAAAPQLSSEGRYRQLIFQRLNKMKRRDACVLLLPGTKCRCIRGTTYARIGGMNKLPERPPHASPPAPFGPRPIAPLNPSAEAVLNKWMDRFVFGLPPAPPPGNGES